MDVSIWRFISVERRLFKKKSSISYKCGQYTSHALESCLRWFHCDAALLTIMISTFHLVYLISYFWIKDKHTFFDVQGINGSVKIIIIHHKNLAQDVNNGGPATCTGAKEF